MNVWRSLYSYFHTNTNKKRVLSAFTIVELLIVVVVIAILASLAVASYGGIKKRAVDSVAQSTLQTVAKKFETSKIREGAYPSQFPADIIPVSGVGLALTVVSSSQEFCANATAKGYTDVQWHVDQTLVLQSGLCAGDVVAASVIGDYNEADGPVVPETFNFEQTVHGNGALGLTVHVGQEWDTAEISWTAQAGAQRYEVQSRNPDSLSSSANSWQYRTVPSGGSGTLNTGNSSFSSELANTITSLNWTDATTGVPKSTGQTFEYRLRYIDGSNTASAWDTASLSYPVQSDTNTRAVSNFTVTPDAGYTSAALSWDQIPDFSPHMGEVKYEVQSRNPDSLSSSANSWQYRTVPSGGSGTLNTGNSSFSSELANTITSLNWTDATTGVPKSTGQTFEYRIRVRISGQSTYYSAWSDTVRAAYPIQDSTNIPEPSNFTVTPDAGYTSAALSWDQIPDFSPHMGEVKYEVQSRNPDSLSSSANSWQYRTVTSGGSGVIYTGNSSFSSELANTITSLNWTDATTGVPKSTGQTFEYRIRVRISGQSTYYSAWVTRSVAHS